jgi:hypothetical protein
MELKHKIEELKYNQYENENFYTVDWVDIETILLAESFRKLFLQNNGIRLDLIFIVLMGIDFMSDVLECPSCPVTQDYFKNFETYIIKKANENK